jgi:hypothetical protein
MVLVAVVVVAVTVVVGAIAKAVFSIFASFWERELVLGHEERLFLLSTKQQLIHFYLGVVAGAIVKAI